MSLFLVTFVLGLLGVAAYLFLGKKEEEKKPAPAPEPEKKKKPKKPKVDITANLGGNKKKKKGRERTASEVGKKSELELVALRGHSEPVTGMAVSLDGSMVASVSTDRTIKVWNITNLAAKPIPYIRVNTKLDHPSAVGFSDDGKYLVVALAESKQLQFYGVKKAAEGEDRGSLTLLHEFQTEHTESIETVLFAPRSAFIMTCAKGQKDLSVQLWTPKGHLLKKINTNQLKNNKAAISPDGRFIAVATMLTDVKIWAVEYSKGGSFEGMELATSLKGHRQGVNYVGFYGKDKVATASVDGSWRLFNLDVQLHIHEEPKIIAQGEPGLKDQVQVVGALPGPVSSSYAVAVAAGPSIQFYNSKTGELIESIEGAHNKDDVTAMMGTQDGKLLMSMGEDKAVKIWRIPQTK